MKLYHMNDPAMINREKFIHPTDKPAQVAKGRRRGGQVRKVKALVKRLKAKGL